jgi:hypothetical protein
MSNFNDEVCEYNSTPTTENFAAKNGNDIVYHRSDCGRGFVRMYGNGGDWPGSVCGAWLHQDYAKIVHDDGFNGGKPGDHNWNIDNITHAAFRKLWE